MDISELNSAFKGLDLVPVVDVDLGLGYQWNEFHAWYSPNKRRFYWASGSGCSCNHLGWNYRAFADLNVGTKPELEAAVRAYFDELFVEPNPDTLLRAVREVRTFRTRGVSA